MNPGAAARVYLRHRRAGVFSTLSKKLAGYPFGSVVPFILVHVIVPQALRFIGGFDVRADGALLRFDFEQPVTGAASVREALAAMARKASAA